MDKFILKEKIQENKLELLPSRFRSGPVYYNRKNNTFYQANLFSPDILYLIEEETLIKQFSSYIPLIGLSSDEAQIQLKKSFGQECFK